MTDEEKNAILRIEERLDAQEERFARWDDLFHGKGEGLGIVAKVHVLWAMKTWLLCTASAAAGAVGSVILTLVVQHFAGG